MLSCFSGGRRAQLLHEVHEALAVADLRHPRLGEDSLDLVVAHLAQELDVVVAVVDERLGVLGEVAHREEGVDVGRHLRRRRCRRALHADLRKRHEETELIQRAAQGDVEAIRAMQARLGQTPKG